MREQEPYGASFEMSHRRMANLSIDTNAFHGQSALISPPESANSARRSSYDMSFHQTPLSDYHPNTPIHLGQDMYNAMPSDKLKLPFQQYPPSPVDFTPGQQHYSTACNSPTWNSSAYAHKPEVDTSFYQDSSALLSTDHWNSSTMSHYSDVDYAPDPNSLFMLPSQDPSASFMTDVDSQQEQLPTFIAPSQAVHQPPELEYSMGISGWGGFQTPVHDSNILHSSSPPEFSPVTPTNLEYSFDASYVSHEASPSSSLYGTSTRSSLTKKGRKMSKADKRRSVCRSVTVNDSNTSITLLTDEKSAAYSRLSKEDQENLKSTADEKLHHCKHSGCTMKFARSEHCKRHQIKHANKYDYACYIADHRLNPEDPKTQCTVGEGKGKQNRNDNSRSHHWTHVKAWLVIHDPLVRERNKPLNGKPKNKGRNCPISPTQMLTLVRNRDSAPDQEVVLKFLNGEAGRDFRVHILWEEEGCPVVPCPCTVGASSCGMCRPIQGKGKKQ
ncbi:hypothetical protein E4T48_00868 [Aureobasidium sp. EXF-10727]|nr:hypothetical protein E4T48_00868 [Aureobasidium sp. EXF-10727]KAI4730583.1 hypothetical protein E4T49_01549 [Aureobasidium sp. EXF-10728]